MAWTSMVLEPGMCLTGVEGYPIVQDQDQVVDTGTYRTGILEVNAGCMTECRLVLEGCETQEGVWTSIVALEGPGDGRRFLRRAAPQGSTDRLPKYIRWRVDFEGKTGAWSTVFRIFLTLKD